MKRLFNYLSFKKEYKNLKKETVEKIKTEFSKEKEVNKKEDHKPENSFFSTIRNHYASFVFESKIKLTFFRNNKFKVLVNFFLLFISSILFLLIFTIPSVLGSYSYSVFHNLSPYVSQIQYTTPPLNSAHVNQINQATSAEKWIKNPYPYLAENPCYNNSQNPWCQQLEKNGLNNETFIQVGDKYSNQTTPVYGTFNPYSGDKYHAYMSFGGSPDKSTLTKYATYLGGMAIDTTWIKKVEEYYKGKPAMSKLVCQVIGEPGSDPGKCILNAISKELPYYLRQQILDKKGTNLNNKFSLLFGRIPYEPKISELYTYLNGKIKDSSQEKGDGANIQVWGLNKNSRLNFLNKYKIKPIDFQNTHKDNRFTWDVVINKATAHLLGLEYTTQYPTFTFTPQIPAIFETSNKSNTSSLAKFSYFHRNVVDAENENKQQGTLNTAFKMCVKSGYRSDCTTDNVDAFTKNGFFQFGWGYDKIPASPTTNNSVSNIVNSLSWPSDAPKLSFNIQNVSNPHPITIRIKGVINQPGNPLIYAPQEDVNYSMLYNANPSIQKKLDNNDLWWMLYTEQYFNGKLSKLDDPLDLTNFTIANSYGDYSQPSLTGGTFYSWITQNKVGTTLQNVSYNNNIKSVIQSIFTPNIFKTTVLRLVLSLFFLFLFLALLIFTISSIIMSSTSNMAILTWRKSITVMKMLGYTNREVSRLSIGFLFWIFIFSFITATVIYLVSLLFVLNKLFTMTNFFIPITFTLWIIPAAFIVMAMVYGITKWLSFRSITRLTSQEVLNS
ncbi:ABC transporter permease [Mycoplasma sp. SG1]|uniref:ABC transporter permease n=1 Tax=Mycoplasma sp. SG1 TaxID=2810348 RepID=UPI002025161E|nr:ABC transporter permease [Mycoplasma sp. SG1]URM52811.1 ABC transporter permease [Mycoplasma sp. SG1]